MRSTLEHVEKFGIKIPFHSMGTAIELMSPKFKEEKKLLNDLCLFSNKIDVHDTILEVEENVERFRAAFRLCIVGRKFKMDNNID